MSPTRAQKPNSKSPSSSLMQTTLGFTKAKPRIESGKKKAKTARVKRQVAIDSPEDSQAAYDDDRSERETSASPTPVPPAPVRDARRDKEIKKEELDVTDKAGQYRTYYKAVLERTGNLPLIHAENQNMIHHILRAFDLSYEYGPCIGVSRLDRWNRAKAIGMSPPEAVRQILMTKQGSEDTQFSMNIFNNHDM
ncbi:hypothetical protein BOTBODRAFT_33071 [Botryobasidium botryosum FD-172 SS1]|uniref:DNA polymerase delta subunit 4 n=1 Tax=Botryobasidium botryosum (strain FD-172 SS1) TaxID=930990 RepID=A0A067MQU5_BOTB1|nr:hypothetical protein BOTBODRAFT_33071 [Botryobasidium botryosum FD-172 SS1]